MVYGLYQGFLFPQHVCPFQHSMRNAYICYGPVPPLVYHWDGRLNRNLLGTAFLCTKMFKETPYLAIRGHCYGNESHAVFNDISNCFIFAKSDMPFFVNLCLSTNVFAPIVSSVNSIHDDKLLGAGKD